jgi:putative hydrolase of the HAD superfamily
MSEFPFILDQAISEVRSCLDERGLLTVTPELMRSRVKEEDHESLDYHSRPLEERLGRIFGLETSTAMDEFLLEMCNRFMTPIFARGKCYEDTLPALKELRSKGVKTGIVSNTSWGSPAELWRNEIRRLGLDSLVHLDVFDRDVGWRKPSERIFKFAMMKLGVQPDECLFVGDEPKWDLIGPRAVGIESILIDRKGDIRHAERKPIKNLHELALEL